MFSGKVKDNQTTGYAGLRQTVNAQCVENVPCQNTRADHFIMSIQVSVTKQNSELIYETITQKNDVGILPTNIMKHE